MERSCRNCELGAVQCIFENPRHVCGSYLPFGWELMTYVNGQWVEGQGYTQCQVETCPHNMNGGCVTGSIIVEDFPANLNFTCSYLGGD